MQMQMQMRSCCGNLLSSGQPASAASNPPAGESVESTVRREILRLNMAGSEQTTQSNPLNAIILNTIIQLQANSSPTSASINRPNSDPNNVPSSALNNGPVNDTFRGPNDIPQTTADLSPEELHIVSLMRMKNASLQNASSIPERMTMPNIEEQLTLLMQQQQAQQARVSTTPDAFYPASDVRTGRQSYMDYLQLPSHLQSDGFRLPDSLLQQPSREHLQLPLHLQSDRARLPDGLLQLQLQRQLHNLVGAAEQQALENLQYQQHEQSDRAMLHGGLLRAQQQSQAFAALTGQQPSQQLTMQQLHYYHQLQQNQRAALPDTHLQASVGSSLFRNLAENASMPPGGSTEPTAASGSGAPTARRQRKKEAFPGKLYHLLADVESRGNSHVISFTPDGSAFKIHDPDAFMKDVAPHYFEQTHFTSFVRQLNSYGFQKLLDSPNRGAFTNPHFLRGREDLVSKMRRRIVPPSVRGTVERHLS
jgi:hypothetical protein